VTTIPIEELEAHLRQILERVQAGERVLIASEGRPVAELSPCDPMAAIDRAFPGANRPAKHLRDIRIERVPLAPGPDVVDVLREIRDDRDLLP